MTRALTLLSLMCLVASRKAVATGAGNPDKPDIAISMAAASVAAVLLWLIAADVGVVKRVLKFH